MIENGRINNKRWVSMIKRLCKCIPTKSFEDHLDSSDCPVWNVRRLLGATEKG